MDWLYDLGRRNLFQMRDTMRNVVKDETSAETWVIEFSQNLVQHIPCLLCSELTQSLKNALIERADGCPDKGLKDTQVATLVDEVRTAIM